MATSMLKAAEEYFGMSFPIPKLEFILKQKLKVGGMENFGLVSITANARGDDLVKIIMHEIVHQWIGNIVTVPGWEFICLQEGLTEFLQLQIRQKSPNFDVSSELLLDRKAVAMKSLYKKDSVLIRHYDSMGTGNLSCFYKSAMAFSTVSEVVGEEMFRIHVKKLLSLFSYSSVDIRKLEREGKAAGHEVADTLLSFFTTKGYPLLFADVQFGVDFTNVLIYQRMIYDDRHLGNETFKGVLPLKIISNMSDPEPEMFNISTFPATLRMAPKRWLTVDTTNMMYRVVFTIKTYERMPSYESSKDFKKFWRMNYMTIVDLKLAICDGLVPLAYDAESSLDDYKKQYKRLSGRKREVDWSSGWQGTCHVGNRHF